MAKISSRGWDSGEGPRATVSGGAGLVPRSNEPMESTMAPMMKYWALMAALAL